MRKLKSRARSLLVPYLLWNVITLAVMAVAQHYLADMLSGKHGLIAETPAWDIVVTYFWIDPICFPFWFIRDLMVMVVLSPLFYLVIRKVPVVLPVIFMLWIVGRMPSITGLGDRSVCFFALGGWFGMHKKSLYRLFDFRMKTVALWMSLYLVWILGLTIGMSYMETYAFGVFHRIGVLTGVVAIFNFTGWLIGRTDDYRPSPFLMGAAFFLFGYHGWMVSLLIKLYGKVVPLTEATVLAGYFGLTALNVFIGIALYYIVQKVSPRFAALITGGR